MRSFVEIGKAVGTDKVTTHAYGPLYERHLGPLRRQDPLVLVEIGVAHGASLRLWEDYLPNAEIHGVDRDPESAAHASDRSVVHICNVLQWEKCGVSVDLPKAIDVVVDDGNHHYRGQDVAFGALWPRLTPGGLYIIEDLAAHRRGKKSSKLGRPNKVYAQQVARLVADLLLYVPSEIAAIHAYPEIAFIEKCTR